MKLTGKRSMVKTELTIMVLTHGWNGTGTNAHSCPSRCHENRQKRDREETFSEVVGSEPVCVLFVVAYTTTALPMYMYSASAESAYLRQYIHGSSRNVFTFQETGMPIYGMDLLRLPPETGMRCILSLCQYADACSHYIAD